MADVGLEAELSPESLYVDFEKPMINVMNEIFPGVIINNCFSIPSKVGDTNFASLSLNQKLKKITKILTRKFGNFSILFREFRIQICIFLIFEKKLLLKITNKC